MNTSKNQSWKPGILEVACLTATIVTTAAATAAGGPLPASNADQLAWQFFAEVNRPAADGSPQAAWESWAEQEVVYEDPCRRPVWPGVDADFDGHPSSLVVTLKTRLASRGLIEDGFNAITGEDNLQQVKINRS